MCLHGLRKELPESSIYLGKMRSGSSLWIMKISPLDVEGVMNMGIYSETVPKIRDKEVSKIKNFRMQKDSPRLKTRKGKPERYRA